MRVAVNATSQLIKSDEDMKKWYKTYYETINKFYKAKPELICPDPEKLTDMLEDLEDQIEKVSQIIFLHISMFWQQNLLFIGYETNIFVTITITLLWNIK